MTDFFEGLAAARPRPALAEVKLDLSGLSEREALDKLSHVLAYCHRSGAASLYVSFPPARAGGGETLFQPVGRLLRAAKKKGEVAQAVPLVDDTAGGFFVYMTAGRA